jgi:hypothetical protein
MELGSVQGSTLDTPLRVSGAFLFQEREREREREDDQVTLDHELRQSGHNWSEV